MKRAAWVAVILALLAPAVTWAQKLPSPTGFVNDFAGLIDSRTEAALTAIAEEVQAKTGAEIAVVTVKSMAPYGSIEEFSEALASRWGVGQEGKDNGVVLVLALEERKARIEVGYGLEGAIPDGLAGRILDEAMVGRFSSGDYSGGFLEGMLAVASIVAKEYGVELGSFDTSKVRDYSVRSGSTMGSYSPFLSMLLLFLIAGGRFFLWPLLFVGAARGRRGFYGGGFGSRSSGGGGFSGFGGAGYAAAGATLA